ncbi:MAG: hypothetical protein IPJ58_16670 [Ardenticatenia bacterium]|nr:hypothetical protein [Ardenticatenia bacterium]
MTLATMVDRTLPLAERVQAALLCWDMDDAHEAARAELIADVAAADRLARAEIALAVAADAVSSLDRPDRVRVKAEWNAAKAERGEALAAYVYRARMAQGADDV